MIKASVPSLSFKPLKFLVVGLISSLTVFSVVAAVAQSGNLLKNGSFEQGLQNWDGPASVNGNYDCSGGAYYGECFAWFEDPNGESIAQEFDGNFSGKYRASVYVKGGPGTLAVWQWCGGQPPQSDSVNFDSSSSWKRVTVDTNPQGCNKIKFEVYLKGKINRLDRASLYPIF